MRALKEIMSWSDYGCADGWLHLFENVELKQPIGEFPAGRTFNSANFDGRTMVLQLNDFEGPYTIRDKQYDFVLTIGSENLSKRKH